MLFRLTQIIFWGGVLYVPQCIGDSNFSPIIQSFLNNLRDSLIYIVTDMASCSIDLDEKYLHSYLDFFASRSSLVVDFVHKNPQRYDLAPLSLANAAGVAPRDVDVGSRFRRSFAKLYFVDALSGGGSLMYTKV